MSIAAHAEIASALVLMPLGRFAVIAVFLLILIFQWQYVNFGFAVIASPPVGGEDLIRICWGTTIVPHFAIGLVFRNNLVAILPQKLVCSPSAAISRVEVHKGAAHNNYFCRCRSCKAARVNAVQRKL